MTRALIHPAEQLCEELEAFSMSAAELSRQLGAPINHVTGILNGQRSITGDTVYQGFTVKA